MKQKIEDIRAQALSALEAASDKVGLEAASVTFLGRKGKVKGLWSRLSGLSAEERPEAGKVINELKEELEGLFAKAKQRMEDAAMETGRGAIDITLPGRPAPCGRLHVLSQVMEEICSIFTRMGFDIVEGPEVELDWYNFTALNFPKEHPARDMQDTLFISSDTVLRTHTSSLQIRTMEKRKPPVRIIAPGKVYRRDSDVTHTPMFQQVEGLVVDKQISLADLKGTLTTFVHQVFGPKTPLRFRASFFPFTEPSAEVDIGCVICRGSGCRICKNSGWLEILGSGMVHPAVFENVGYDPDEVTGFAFGLGVERVTMLKYGLDDLRRFYENDMRFLGQF